MSGPGVRVRIGTAADVPALRELISVSVRALSRGFFVHPDWVPPGVGTAILRACIEAARAAVFRELELAATLPGVPLYAAFGFEARERTAAPLRDGTQLPIVRMTRSIEDG